MTEYGAVATTGNPGSDAMTRGSLALVAPRFVPPFDDRFRPAVLGNRAFRSDVRAAGASVPLVFGLERGGGESSRFETAIFPEGHARFEANLEYAAHLLKFLLWQRGGWRVHVGGPRAIGDHLRSTYSPGGARHFDQHFMGAEVYERPFTVVPCRADEVPPANEKLRPLGRHFDGCRIGFDLGASVRKVSAVIDGRPVFSDEVSWSPSTHADAAYHYNEIVTMLKTAAVKMPRVDAIGGSSAGIYIDNRVVIASLFRGIPLAHFGDVREMFVRIEREFGVPLQVINDGDVTALAGSMALDDNGVLGIALGSSQAAGYVTLSGHVSRWINELAFAPVDYQPDAPLDEWSGDRGCGSQYFSQQCVIRLARAAGIAMPPTAPDADKFACVQQRLDAGDERARRIWISMGYYLAYGLAHYADFYELRHVLILGGCTSGFGGPLMIEAARSVLAEEFPELGHIQIQLPDEKSRRVGLAIAAASLPPLAE